MVTSLFMQILLIDFARMAQQTTWHFCIRRGDDGKHRRKSPCRQNPTRGKPLFCVSATAGLQYHHQV
jgi:hypothetical protein